MATLNPPKSDLAKLENHLRQLEACRLAPEEDAPILQQFPGLRQALCAKINAKGCQIGFGKHRGARLMGPQIMVQPAYWFKFWSVPTWNR